MNSYKQLLASMETEISQLHQDYNAEISKLKDQLRDKTEEKIAQLRQESSQVMERSAEASQLEKFVSETESHRFSIRLSIPIVMALG